MSQTMEPRTQTQREKQLLQMEQDLGACRRAIFVAVFLRNIYRMLIELLLVITIAAVAEITSSTVRLFFGEMYRWLDTAPGYVGIFVGLVGFHVLMILAIRRIVQERPKHCETAERLDIAVDDHNRIATAWWLLHAKQQSPFVDAAIEDGLAHLKLFSHATPDRSGPWPVLKKYRSRFLIASLLLVVAILFQPGAAYFPMRNDDPSNQVAQGLAGAVPPEVTEASNPANVERRPTAKPNPATSPDQSAATASEATEKLPGSDKETEGSSGRGKSSSAQSSSNASAANSSSSDSSSETKGKLTKKPEKEKKPGKKKPFKETKAQEPQDTNGGSSSVSQGSSGGGSMMAVQHDWAQHAQAAGSEAEDDFDDEDGEIDDENEENRQRGGIQPTLKDRNESPSRELGIGEGDGPPGTGRGGPTPPKKSRGTASLVLGVPVPDFVRGRLSPGPTKITQERVRPVPMGAEPSESTEARRRTIPEPVIPRTNLPAEMLPLIQEYLIRLHQSE